MQGQIKASRPTGLVETGPGKLNKGKGLLSTMPGGSLNPLIVESLNG
jgi:hypothetical protein